MVTKVLLTFHISIFKVLLKQKQGMLTQIDSLLWPASRYF